ncbi:hypothetical protein C1646_772519 [Rhizophagus diaphanus]|nr:hypothetical protein C1646_772519 [Rhizophagus diaphanus] [Rhizophagus sp. MUCL 43196]
MAFLRKFIQTNSFNSSLSQFFPWFFLSDVLSLKPLKIFPTESFDDLRRKGYYYLDKTHFISKIEAKCAPAVLSLRPHYFGKTLFLSTLSSYYDIKNRDRFKQLFQDLYIGKNPTPLASKFLILNLNFAGLQLGNYFKVIDEKKSALANFIKLLDMVDLSNNKLYICIDDYDASMNEILRNKELLQTLISHHKTKDDFIKSKFKLIESSFIQFFSELKTACDEGIARIFLTGMTPISMDDFSSGFNISEDLALKEEFWDLYGFKKWDIKILLDKVLENNVSNDVKQKVMSWLIEENDGYFFHRNQSQGIFNTGYILYYINNLIDQKKYLNNKYIRCDKYATVNFNTLFNFPSNLHILSIQIILNLIINNPLGKSILIEALNQHLNLCNSIQSFIFPNCIKQRFQLSNIHELATDHTSLLSFMFYSGAITYQSNLSRSSLQHNFQIQNRVIKREFIIEMLKIYNWKKEDLIPIRNYLQILKAEYNIKPLCRFIENNLLKPLKDNSIKHLNEEVLEQIFMDTLTLTLHTDIKPEFQVFFQNSNFEKVINLVKINTGKVIAIEFDNIKIENVKLDGIQSNRQKATDLSQLLLEKSEDEILSLEISNRYQPNQKTV